MILVNINKSGAKAVTAEQIEEAAAGAWVLSEKSEEEYADVLVAVRKNTVVGVWTIEEVYRGEDSRASFTLSDAPDFADLVGQPSPVEWKQGAANPVKLVETATLQQKSSEVELTPQGNQRVRLERWTLVVYPDGRARLSPPSESRVVVESAFPGPSGANVTVRI